jgi:multimeric flavodoxin WrbA
MPPLSDPQQQPHVVAVVGSPRRQGNVAALVGAALEELRRHGCRCTTLTLSDLRINACDGHSNCGELERCPHDDDMAGVLEAVYGADGLILASPVYYENVSSQMKAFMDRTATRYYHEEWLLPKIVGLVAIAAETGLSDTLSAMRRFMALSSGEELPILSLGGCADKPGEAAADAQLMAEARDLGRAMAARLGSERGETPA